MSIEAETYIYFILLKLLNMWFYLNIQRSKIGQISYMGDGAIQLVYALEKQIDNETNNYNVKKLYMYF